MRNEHDYSTLFYFNPLPNWVYDMETFEILDVNQSAMNHYGYSKEEFLSMTIRDLRPKEEMSKLNAAHVDVDAKKGNIYFGTFTHQKKNGEKIKVDVNGHKVEFMDRKCIMVTCQDVTAAKNEQLQKDLLAKISTIFNEGIDLGTSLQEVCQLIVNHGAFSFCEIWLPDIHKKTLKRNSSCTQDAVGKAFYAHAENPAKMEIGVGIPGTVWQENKPVIWEDNGQNEPFARNRAAQAAGLKAVVGMPLLHQENTVGVLVVGTGSNAGQVKEHHSGLMKLQPFIGSEINRKRLEGELSHLFEALPDIICLCDFNGTCLKMNRAGCELLGYEQDEIVGNSFTKFIHPDDETILANEIRKLSQGERVLKFENRLLTRSGKVLWLSWHANSNVPEGIIYASGKNITEEKKLQELVGNASQLAKIGSWELDLTEEDADTMYWSPMLKKILEVEDDYKPSFTAGFEFFAQKSKEKIRAAVDLLIQHGVEFDEELLLIAKSGKEKWVRCIGKSERSNGVCSKIFGSFQDIDSMKSTELQLSEILGSISDAFYAVDRDWNFTYFNKEAENLLNRSSKDLLGKNIWDEFPQAKGTDLERIYRSVAAQGKAENFEYFYPGDGCWYELNAYPSNGGISCYFKNVDEKRRAAEEITKAYEEKIKIIESIGDAFFTMNSEFTVTYWNNNAESLIGIKREDLVGKNLWDVFPDAVNLPSYTHYHQVLKTGEPITFEDYYGVWLEVNAYPSDDGITVFFRDITLRKEADERLLRAFEEKNRILESIGDAFFAVDKEWTVTYWNKEAEQVLGRSREVIVGKNLWQEYADAIDTDFYRQYHKAMASGENVSFEEFYPTLNKWFEVVAYPSADGLSVYFKDISLRKVIDLQILRANERFEKVTQATADAIWDWDIENDSFYRGMGFERFFGHKVKRNLTSADFWQDSFHSEDQPALVKSLEASLANPDQGNWQMEYRVIDGDGEEKTVVDKGMIIRNESGKAIRMVGAMTDISERKWHEKEIQGLNQILKENINQLKITNEQLEQFAFIASHDLQEPLRMISSFLNQLERKYGHQLDAKAHEYIHFATDGAKRMKHIILDLLEYSRAGNFAESPEHVNFNELIKEYQILRRKLLQEKKAKLIYDHLPSVKCFKAPLTQTLHCLLDNAIKYSREGVPPIIKILASEKGYDWQLSISDNGIGIDPLFFEKIFIIFQRLHNQDRYEGTGIGLSIAKKHVESWGGKIWLESSPGKGSTFSFTINYNLG